MTTYELLEYSRLRQLNDVEFLSAWRDAMTGDNKTHLETVELAAVVRYLSFGEAVRQYMEQFPDGSAISSRTKVGPPEIP